MPMTMHRKKEQGLATRQKILEAAEDIFFEKGAALTTLEQIADRANVTRGAIYGHFKNKRMLLEHIIDSAVLPLLDIFRETISRDPIPSFEQLQKAHVQVITDIINSAELKKRLSIAFVKCEYTEEFAYLIEQSIHYHDEVRNIYKVFFSRMEKSGIKLAKNPEIMADALMLYVTGMLTEYFKYPGQTNLEKNINEYFDLFFFPISCPSPE